MHEVSWRALGNVDYARDLTVVEGPVDHLDHASYQQFWGGKAGIDATRKLPEEGYTRDGGWPRDGRVRPGDRAKVSRALEGVRPVSSASEGVVGPAPGAGAVPTPDGCGPSCGWS